MATVARGEIRIAPADMAGYPPALVLRSANEAVVWTGDLVPLIEGTTLGNGEWLATNEDSCVSFEPVQGESGTWVIFGDGDAGVFDPMTGAGSASCFGTSRYRGGMGPRQVALRNPPEGC